MGRDYFDEGSSRKGKGKFQKKNRRDDNDRSFRDNKKRNKPKRGGKKFD